jgi:hypothetical protein
MHLHPLLSGLDGGDVARNTTADDDEVLLLCFKPVSRNSPTTETQGNANQQRTHMSCSIATLRKQSWASCNDASASRAIFHPLPQYNPTSTAQRPVWPQSLLLISATALLSIDVKYYPSWVESQLTARGIPRRPRENTKKTWREEWWCRQGSRKRSVATGFAELEMRDVGSCRP